MAKAHDISVTTMETSANEKVKLYEASTTLPTRHFSPYVARIRIALNYKKIPFETVWIKGVDIERTAKEVGAPPTRTLLDGRPGYTTPFVVIESPGKPDVALSDSEVIARYFDERDNDPSRKLFAKENGILEAYFIEHFRKTILLNIARINMVTWMKIFESDAVDYFKRSRENVYGIPIHILIPQTEEAIEKLWQDAEKALDELAALMDKAEVGSCRITPRVSYPEIAVVSLFHVTRAVSAGDPNGWLRLASRNGGRWARMLEIEEYKTLDSVHA